MSEKQTKKINKNISKVKTKRRASGSDVIFNVIITVVILAVLGLGVYAVGSKYVANKPADGEQQTEQAPKKTVADFAKEKGMTFDEFKAEYGLSEDKEVTEDADIQAVSGKFTLDNYAKYTDTTIEELKSKYALGNNVPNTTIWSDAISFMTTGVVAQNFFGTDFDTFKKQMGNMPDTITADTPWSETEAVMNKIMAEQQQAQADNANQGTAQTPEQPATK